MSTPTPYDPTAGEGRLGPFRLVRPISAGGMARVYEGRLDSLHGVSTRVAVKVIHPEFALEPGFQELFVAEARISARLEHQNLVRIQQFNQEGNLLYLVMEYIDGVTLRKMITLARRHGLELPVGVVAELGRQVCDGLHYAHLATTEDGFPLHLVHRDVKPSNVMLNAQGVVKVLDFGISYAHPAHVGAELDEGGVKGTWGYMAPEQAEGGMVGPQADLFGLASVLYELCTLEPLFDEKDNQVLRQLLAADEAARRAAGLGEPYGQLAGVLVRALQRDPAARYSSAASMGRALAGLVGDPLRASDGLVQLLQQLRELDGSATPADRARSISTMTQAAAAARRPTGRPSTPNRGSSAGTAGAIALGSIVAAFVILASVSILGYTAWRLWVTRPSAEPPVVVTEPVKAPPAPTALTAPTSAPAPAAATPAEPRKTTTTTTTTSTSTSADKKTTTTPSKATTAPSPPPATPPTPAPTPTPSTSTSASTPSTSSTTPSSGTGTLSIGADVRSQVIVDGQFLSYTPLMKAVAAGRHTVKLVTSDGRTKVFSVVVPAGGSVSRSWDFSTGDDGG